MRYRLMLTITTIAIASMVGGSSLAQGPADNGPRSGNWPSVSNRAQEAMPPSQWLPPSPECSRDPVNCGRDEPRHGERGKTHRRARASAER
jgi:hypothetical protein